MKTYRLTERVTVVRAYVIDAASEDDALDKLNSGKYVPTETEEENMNGIEVAIIQKEKMR